MRRRMGGISSTNRRQAACADVVHAHAVASSCGEVRRATTSSQEKVGQCVGGSSFQAHLRSSLGWKAELEGVGPPSGLIWKHTHMEWIASPFSQCEWEGGEKRRRKGEGKVERSD